MNDAVDVDMELACFAASRVALAITKGLFIHTLLMVRLGCSSEASSEMPVLCDHCLSSTVKADLWHPALRPPVPQSPPPPPPPPSVGASALLQVLRAGGSLAMPCPERDHRDCTAGHRNREGLLNGQQMLPGGQAAEVEI